MQRRRLFFQSHSDALPEPPLLLNTIVPPFLYPTLWLPVLSTHATHPFNSSLFPFGFLLPLMAPLSSLTVSLVSYPITPIFCFMPSVFTAGDLCKLIYIFWHPFLLCGPFWLHSFLVVNSNLFHSYYWALSFPVTLTYTRCSCILHCIWWIYPSCRMEK